MSSLQERFTALRERRPALDHLVRAAQRYQADTGDRLAASVTFFGFLSFFPLLALSASLLALFLGDSAITTVAREVDSFAPGLSEQLGLETLLEENTSTALGLAGLASLAGLLYAGLGWVDALREAVRTVWHQNVKAGNFLKKKAVDVVILAGLGATLVFSVLVSAAAGAFTGVFLDLVGLDDGPVGNLLVTLLGTVLALLTSTLLFLYLFIRLPKVQTPWRKVLRGAVLAAVLFEVLKRVGAVYVERTTENPLYGAFAVVVGLLVWINLVSRMLLFCAAWTVTAPFDSDVAPSGTADPEQARKAGIPEEFADGDPDEPPVIQKDGAPSPLLAATMGATPPQDEPEGPPSRQEHPRAARRRGRVPADRSAAADAGLDARSSAGPAPDPYPDEPDRPAAQVPGEVAVRRVAQAGAALVSAGLVGVGVYAVRTAVGVLRR
ncbi:MAG TPA: YhjD/YihY/BrkB family envelope integrity protein [Mycobacteriales bacterium]|nr:YhjD/YihY/BrkB family envelope integrity protein [Mycobacteriales bacterium]